MLSCFFYDSILILVIKKTNRDMIFIIIFKQIYLKLILFLEKCNFADFDKKKYLAILVVLAEDAVLCFG